MLNKDVRESCEKKYRLPCQVRSDDNRFQVFKRCVLQTFSDTLITPKEEASGKVLVCNISNYLTTETFYCKNHIPGLL